MIIPIIVFCLIYLWGNCTIKYDAINIEVSTQGIHIFTSTRNQQLAISYKLVTLAIAHCHQILFCHIISLLDHDVNKNVIDDWKNRLIFEKYFVFIFIFGFY